MIAKDIESTFQKAVGGMADYFLTFRAIEKPTRFLWRMGLSAVLM